jgi:hypothetical protein
MATLNSRTLMRMEQGNQVSDPTSVLFVSTPSGLWSDRVGTGSKLSGNKLSVPIALAVTNESNIYVDTTLGSITPANNDGKEMELSVRSHFLNIRL